MTEPLVDPDEDLEGVKTSFAEAERLAARRDLVESVVRGLLIGAVIIAMVLLGWVAIVRGNSIQRGEDERAGLRRQLDGVLAELEAVREDARAVRADLDQRDEFDACVSRVGGALQIAMAELLDSAIAPRLPDGPPPDLAAIQEDLAALGKAVEDRRAAAAICDREVNP